MDEPKEGATTLKKKAQEKLAAKANPVEETPVVEAVVESSEPEAVVAAVETEVAAVETEAAVETPAEEEAK
jgi:small subunit ribosomal protein S16